MVLKPLFSAMIDLKMSKDRYMHPIRFRAWERSNLGSQQLYKCSIDGMLLLCLDQAYIDRVMREVHEVVYRLHMRGHMLVQKIISNDYFWLSIETDCCLFV